jgi:hypothetical protein
VDGLVASSASVAFQRVFSPLNLSSNFREKYPNAMPAAGYPHEGKIRIV